MYQFVIKWYLTKEFAHSVNNIKPEMNSDILLEMVKCNIKVGSMEYNVFCCDSLDMGMMEYMGAVETNTLEILNEFMEESIKKLKDQNFQVTFAVAFSDENKKMVFSEFGNLI